MGVAQDLRKFIMAFSTMATPLHVIKKSGKSLNWGKISINNLNN